MSIADLLLKCLALEPLRIPVLPGVPTTANLTVECPGCLQSPVRL